MRYRNKALEAAWFAVKPYLMRVTELTLHDASGTCLARAPLHAADAGASVVYDAPDTESIGPIGAGPIACGRLVNADGITVATLDADEMGFSRASFGPGTHICFEGGKISCSMG